MNYVKGTYIKEIFKNPDNGYIVGVFKIKSTDLKITNTNIYFIGTFYNLKIKNNYILYGEYVNHNKYGARFQVSSYEVSLPTKREELIDFLSSDLFPIGRSTASSIVEKLKENVCEKIIEDKTVLNDIKHLRASTIDKIYNTLVDYQSSNKMILDITSLGFSIKSALTIINKYKTESISKILNNIYDLVEDINFPFTDIDAIALKSGIKEDDDRRIQALIIYSIMNTTFESGSTYLEYDELKTSILKMYSDIDLELLDSNINVLTELKKIVIENGHYYLYEYYEAEKYIAYKLCFLNDITSKEPSKVMEKIALLEKRNNIVYDKTQKLAIKKAVVNNVTIITGGPGSGKTTIIKAIISLYRSIFKARDEDFALLAPTGRAAKKMFDATNIHASTIHRYLAYDKDTNKFNVNEYNPNREKYIIVDEVSMLDTMLMLSLLKGIRRDVKLVLVGDYYQLPSIRQGQVLKDIIDSNYLDVVELNCLYRQNENSYIPILASEIKEKDVSDSFITKKDDYNFICCDNNMVMSNILYIVDNAIKKGYTDKDIQVLAPMYKGINGIDLLNKNLQELFNKESYDKNELVLSEVTYRVGDKVLQLVNDTENNVYNGDLGYIVDIIDSKRSESKKNEIIVDYDGNYVVYTSDKFSNIRHGWAISIHKSQGSEFDIVIMPIVNNFNRMLYNKLIYTGVTRAKKALMIVGDPNCFLHGVLNERVDYRKTTLKDFIIDKYEFMNKNV